MLIAPRHQRTKRHLAGFTGVSVAQRPSVSELDRRSEKRDPVTDVWSRCTRPGARASQCLRCTRPDPAAPQSHVLTRRFGLFFLLYFQTSREMTTQGGCTPSQPGWAQGAARPLPLPLRRGRILTAAVFHPEKRSGTITGIRETSGKAADSAFLSVTATRPRAEPGAAAGRPAPCLHSAGR